MSDLMTIVLVVLVMLCSPLLVAGFMVWYDGYLEREAKEARFEALIKAMDDGVDFLYFLSFDVPCPECGSAWQGEREGHWVMEHRQDCLLEAAMVEQSRRFDLFLALDAEIMAKEAAEEEAEYEAWIWAENEALDR